MSVTKPATRREPPEYPDRAQNLKPGCDSGRRRFLRQLAAGTGAAMVGLPRLSHGQSLAVDFDKLSGHPTLASVTEDSDADSEGELLSEIVGPDDEHAIADAIAGFDADAAAGSGAPGAAAGQEAGPVAEAEPELAESTGSDAWIEENRALWVEPGYLILLKWQRPIDDETPVAALEGAVDQLQRFLTGRVGGVDDLHNLELLHPLEREVVALLQPIVRPAEIGVLHLDHDCTAVCSLLNPSRHYPEIIEVDGGMPMPGWE